MHPKPEKQREFYDVVYSEDKRLRAWKDPDISLILGKERVYSKIAETLNNRRVLDIACGSGQVYNILNRYKTSANYIGIDISLDGLKQLKKRNGVCVLGDAHKLPFKRNSVDVVVFYAALHHLNIKKILNGISKILKHGGFVIFHEPLKGNLFNQVIYKYAKHPERYILSRFILKLLGLKPDNIRISPDEERFDYRFLKKEISRYFKIEYEFRHGIFQGSLANLLLFIREPFIRKLLMKLFKNYSCFEDWLANKLPGKLSEIVFFVAEKD